MQSSTPFSFLVAALCATAPVFAQGKSEIRERMLALDARILSLRAHGAPQSAIERLQREYAELSERLGGGRILAPRVHESATWSESLASTPLYVTTPLPPGSNATTTTFTGTGGPLPDVTTVMFTLPVSGAGTYVWDVDLTTDITHTWCGDLEIELFAPSGKRVTISNDNAEGYSNVFSGTLWDDSSPNSAYIYPFVDFTTATPLNSEGKFRRLIGDDPNGVWTLRITDDAGQDVGQLHSWKLDITTLSAPPSAPSSPVTFTSSPNLAIPDNTVVSDTIAVAGVGPSLAEARVRLALTHTYNADLLIDLISPSGATIRLASYIGAENDDVFNGTDLYDTASEVGAPLNDAPIALYSYVDGVAAVAVNPEGTLASLNGTDPNGNWTLRIEDTAGGDVGNLSSWQLSFSTYGGSPPAPVNYCTAGTTTNGCVPSISADANPSVSFTNACHVSVANVEGQKNAILFYGLAANAAPWGAGSSSFLCVKAPTQRTGGQSSGGASNACDGALALDWNAFQLANQSALGAPWSVGEKAYVQAWFRDPPAAKTTNLSNGLELTYQP